MNETIHPSGILIFTLGMGEKCFISNINKFFSSCGMNLGLLQNVENFNIFLTLVNVANSVTLQLKLAI